MADNFFIINVCLSAWLFFCYYGNSQTTEYFVYDSFNMLKLSDLKLIKRWGKLS